MIDGEGRPLPGTCFAVGLGLRGAELPSAFAQVDVQALREGVTMGEVCDTADGQLDGTLTVGGTLGSLLGALEAVLVESPEREDLRGDLEGVVLTIDLSRTRVPAMPDGTPMHVTAPQIAINLVDLLDGRSVQVVSAKPVAAGASQEGDPAAPTPPSSDGTGITD